MPKSQLYGMPARYLATPPTLSDGDFTPLLVNENGALITSGGGGGGSYTFENGLTEADGTVKLGGELSTPLFLLNPDGQTGGIVIGLGFDEVSQPTDTFGSEIMLGAGYIAFLALDSSGDSPVMNQFGFNATSIASTAYPNTRDDSAEVEPINFLYTDDGGIFYSAPITKIIPTPPPSGNYSLKSADGVMSWVAD